MHQQFHLFPLLSLVTLSLSLSLSLSWLDLDCIQRCSLWQLSDAQPHHQFLSCVTRILTRTVIGQTQQRIKHLSVAAKCGLQTKAADVLLSLSAVSTVSWRKVCFAQKTSEIRQRRQYSQRNTNATKYGSHQPQLELMIFSLSKLSF
jgi:hypothetical protein